VALVAVAVGSPVLLRLRQPAETVYTVEADAYGSTAHPDANFGSVPVLRTDATPRLHSYLRFRLAGLSGRVVHAQLRLWSSTGNLAGYSVRAVPDTSWSERAITSRHRPTAAGAITRSGPFGPDEWSSTDVTGLVEGKDEVSLVVTTRSTKPSRSTAAKATTSRSW
jgi:hypothetical protein